MKPTSRIEILKALQEKRISQAEAFDALKNLQKVDQPASINEKPAFEKKSQINPNSGTANSEAIAIVGLSGKFPGASNADEFWDNIKNGVDSVTEIPEHRWSVKDFYDKDRTAPDKTYSKWQGLVDDIEYFDPLFFNLSPREASYIDPQQRLFLEECWKTFEDAGFSPDDVMGSKCGVYVGAADGDYLKRLKDETTMPYTLIGNSSAILSARISYLLNLKGPSMSINTACSGSLVAIHLATQSILSGECSMALAGGVYLQTSEDLHVQTSKAGMLSEDGRCKAFDQSGNGFVPAEGVGVVLLKKLSEAEKDGDHIYGVIKGSRINQDGSTNGITAPSAESQRNLEIACYKDFKINPEDISYVECHGTGTKLGDPIEIDALTGSFNQFTQSKQFCAVGSVKTNIGHALSAAGVASVIKVLMAMKHGQIAPSLHFNQPNEHINFKDSPFYVNTQLKEWKPVKGKRLAAISSFGFSGTNAHLVIEDYQAVKKTSDNRPPAIIPVSAKSEKQLNTAIADLKSYLERKDYELDQISYTLQTGRRAHEYRVAMMAWDVASLISLCTTYLDGRTSDQIFINNGQLTSRVNNTSQNLNDIAQNWVSGQSVDWKILYNSIPQKVSLPTYPFERVRCWIERKVEQVSQLVVNKNIAEPVQIEDKKPLSKVEESKAVNPKTQEVKTYLRKELAAILYIEESKITDQKEFSKIGLDSVVGVEVINKINTEYDLQLEAQVFYDYATIDQLTNHIINQLHGESNQITNTEKIEEVVVMETPKEIPASQGNGQLRQFLKEKLAEILYVDQKIITDQKEFSKIGLDSIVGVELINVINAEYDINLEASSLYEYKNLQLLVQYVTAEIGQDIEVQSNPDDEKITPEVKVEESANRDNGELKSFLRTHLSKILYLDESKIGDKTKFSSIGLDSVVGVELVQVINDEYKTAIEAGSLYEYVDLESLTNYVSSQVLPVTTSDKTDNSGSAEQSINVSSSKVKVELISNPVLKKPVINHEGKVQLVDLSTFKPVSKTTASKVILPEVKLKNPTAKVEIQAEEKPVQKAESVEVKPKLGTSDSNHMAIVGVSGRYPKAADLEKFWKNLKNAKNCITEVPKERWDFEKYFSTNKTDKTKSGSKWGGFIADADKFSPLFFNLSPREAENMDPQERLLLEVLWATIEDAGYTPDTLNKDSVGVFIGNMINQYCLVAKDEEQRAAILNGSNWSLANRLSFFYDFAGPSLVINTACSSSLTAIYMACESIKRGECKYAIAGGINLNLHPSKWVGLSNSGMIGAEGKSQSLGNGEGYIPGEGVGTVLIKPLADAIADKDHIYGVVKGGYINHGGRSTGFTVPNQERQKELVAGVLKEAGISPKQVDYIETASNGSQVGDPIEIDGLLHAFNNSERNIPIGTVKSNIGHCEAASGISQVTKVLMQYKYSELVPSINSDPLNPKINLADSPFYVQKEVTKIDDQAEFNTLVNSFGAGGSNAQLIISRFAKKTDSYTTTPIGKLIVLSGEDQDALKRIAGNLIGYLNKQTKANSVSIEQIAYTLQVGRTSQEQRMTILADSTKELTDLLKGYLSGKINSEKLQINPNPVEEEKQLSLNDHQTIEADVKSGNYQSLIDHWLAGYNIDWKAFYSDQIPQKVSLPTYPFKGESYWAGQMGLIGTTADSNKSEQTTTEKKQKNGVKVDSSAIVPVPVQNEKNNPIVKVEVKVNQPEELKTQLSEYLKEVCSDLLKIPVQKMSDNKPFSAFGIDSILVREITEILEKKIGALPKTLFFQCANIKELTDYLAKNHENQIREVFSSAMSESSDQEIIDEKPVNSSNTDFFTKKSELTEDQRNVMRSIGGIHVKGFYLLDIWTHIYISETNDFYFHILREGNYLFVTWFAGNPENEVNAVAKMQTIADKLGCKMIYWSNGDYQFPGFTSTVIAAFQTIENIDKFSLQGSKKKKLRYMVNKYAKEGEVLVTEYKEINEETDQEIKQVILKWTENKQFVNSVDHAIGEVIDGSWKERYRLFLTYLDGALQSVIFINRLTNGVYLLDQEYYLPDMPLGSTEYSMIEIMKQLSAEGENSFSFGLTWKILEDLDDGDDVAGTRFLKELRGKETILSQIYERGSKNFQYKMKFLPRNSNCYLHRPIDSDPEVIVEFLSLFIQRGVSHEEVKQLIETGNINGVEKPTQQKNNADNRIDVKKTPQPQQVITKSDEEEYGFFDVTTVPDSDITVDLMSDSWVYYKNHQIRERISELSDRIDENCQYEQVIKEVLGLPHLHISPMGRSAEKLFFAVASKNKGVIASNLLFYTTIHHLSEKGFQLMEFPDQKAVNTDPETLFRGGIDLTALRNYIAEQPGKVQMILIELCNNASGGYPISMSHLKEVSKLAAENEINFTLDITRVVKNAFFIKDHEQGYESVNVWDIVREIHALADNVVGSLSKDFCINKGGILGGKKAKFVYEAKQYAKVEGSYVSEIDMAVIGESFKDLDYIEYGVRAQIESAAKLVSHLIELNIPVITPATAHCLLIRVEDQAKYAKESFLKKVLKNSGIRGGLHLPGQQSDTRLNDCVRFCIPIGLTDSHVDQAIDLFGEVFDKPVEKNSNIDSGKNAKEHTVDIPIAIVGLSVSFPKSPDKASFWKNLKNAEDCTDQIPAVRLGNTDPDSVSPMLLRGGFMADADQFDPLFFGISPKEARLMDPQQRLILEKSWEAVEDAGYTREELSKRTTGVFIGIPNTDYRMNDASEESFGTTGLAASIASSRISYTLNLSGPSEIYNTNCSSSLVALHRAIQSIRLSECSEAIVGGVQVISSLHNMKVVEALGVLSPLGKSLSFDKDADGYVRSEGVGAMLIKPLHQAEKDGDHIYAVVKGTAVGHGGSGLSLTAPNARGMKDVMVRAYQQAGIKPDTVQYIEAHGISSPTPDAIELDALKSAYDELNQLGEYNSVAKISAIKPVIGHAEYASGMAIITKVIMAMQEKMIPGIPFLKELNPDITVGNKPLKLSAENEYWKAAVDEQGKILPRRASLNSYGTGGVNAHIVLEEYVPGRKKRTANNNQNVFLLSADSQNVLKNYVFKLQEFLKTSNLEHQLDHVAYTLQIGREARVERVAFIATNQQALMQLIEIYLSDDNHELISTGNIDENNSDEGTLPSNQEIEAILQNTSTHVNELKVLAKAWVNGIEPDWAKLYAGKEMQRMSLPTYPFDKKSYWVAQNVSPDYSLKKENEGIPPNGVSSNGIPSNGVAANGVVSNGVVSNGVVSNGVAANGVSSNDISGYTQKDQSVFSFEYIRSFMIKYLISEMELEETMIKTDKNMIDFGVDSIIGQKLAKEFLDQFQIKVKGREMLEYQTIDALAKYLSDREAEKTSESIEQDIETDVQSTDEIVALEKFKKGEISLEEIEKLV